MATPVGHVIAGLGLFWLAERAARLRRMPLSWLAILFALLPDFDFLPGLVLGRPAAYHQGLTHSVGFAFAAALIGTWAIRQWARCSARTLFLLLFSCYISHLLLDFFGSDGRPPYGIPIFWPLSAEYHLSPVPLFPGVRHAAHADARLYQWMEGVVSWHNVRGILIEMLLLMPFALGWTWRQIRKNKTSQVDTDPTLSSWWST